MRVHLPEVDRLAQPQADVRGEHALGVRSILRLQQTIGNREVVRLIAPPSASPSACPAESAIAEPIVVAWSAAPWRQRLSLVWKRIARRRAAPGQAEPVCAIDDPQ